MTIMKSTSVLLVVISLLVIRDSSCRPVTIEAEKYSKNQGYNAERFIPRGNASKKQNVHLFPGESIMLYFCLQNETNVTIDKVAYSNDGHVDYITVSLDEVVVRKMQTNNITNFGHLWNVLRTNNGSIAERKKLASGLHTIKIKVENGDDYGVEIDSVKLLVENISADSDIMCTDDQIKSASVKITTENPSKPESKVEGSKAESKNNNSKAVINNESSKPLSNDQSNKTKNKVEDSKVENKGVNPGSIEGNGIQGNVDEGTKQGTSDESGEPTSGEEGGRLKRDDESGLSNEEKENEDERSLDEECK